MTEEYKNNLLKYFVNELEQDTGVNSPKIKEIKEIATNLDQFIRIYYPGLTNNWVISSIFTRNDYIIAWCSDYSGIPARWLKSFVVIMDKNFQPLYYKDKYGSGSTIYNLSVIDSEDDGTGNIIGVETVFDSSGNVSRKRVVVLNDFTLTNFNIKILSSWNIPKRNNYIVDIKQITKNKNSGKYFMLYNYTDNNSLNYGGALEFINNVGAENEWNFYEYTGSRQISWTYAIGVPTWEEDKFSFKFICPYIKAQDKMGLIVFKENVSGDTKTSVEEKILNLPPECQNLDFISAYSIVGNKAIAKGSTSDFDNHSNYIIQFDIINNTYKVLFAKNDYIYEEESQGNFNASMDAITIFKVNNQVFYTRRYTYAKYVSYISTQYYQNDLYLGQIFNDEIYEFYIKDLRQGNSHKNISANNVYNLYDINLVFSNYTLKINEVFNPNNYNGNSYIDKNSLDPNSAELYNGDDIIFARNLYNKTINDNITTSTLQIPNSMLNDITINSEKLVSKNNNIIIDNDLDINKNIYEELNINFINTITMMNANNQDNIKTNQLGAIRLNKSATDIIDYEDATMNKYRINYEDGTEYVSMLGWSPVGNYYRTNLALTISKEIKNIELISNDESTVYCTIEGNFEVGKTYSIKQDVYIDYKKLPEKVYYGEDEVYYNEQEVYY